LGGDDKVRLADLQAQLDDPEVKAIFIARGGYGTIRVLQALDAKAFKQNPKWIIGYSDITALHGWIYTQTGFPSLHASMPVLFDTCSDNALQSLWSGLKGKPQSITADSNPLNVKGECNGTLIGGNLSVLYSMQGTFVLPDFEGAILAIEDIDEYLYHIDRMMQNFSISGLLKKLKGIIIGGMTDMRDHETPFGGTAESIIADLIKKEGIPMAFGMPFGHIQDNHALMLGHKVNLEVTDRGSSLYYLD
jgi:muramoyltetrapeptide carboxypeptidase